MNYKKIINSYPIRSAQSIIKEIKKYDIVSFDIFDTLIKRDLKTEKDVFVLVEREFNIKHGIGINNFMEMRVLAENKEREDKKGKEIRIEEIYQRLTSQKLRTKKDEYIEISDKLALEFMDIERNIEYLVCQLNYTMYLVYSYCKKSNKKIFIISDMYWGSEFIKSILAKNGINGYSNLYVSSEIGVQKRSGELFSYIRETKKVNLKKWIHIGDNKKADFIGAKKNGIATVCIAKNIVNTKYLHMDTVENDLTRNVICSFINNRITSIKENHIKIGYEVYGPLLYFFTKWLTKKLDPSKTTLFLARDCYIVKQAYEIIQGSNEKNIYFLGSRKSLIIPALKDNASLEYISQLIRSEPLKMTIEGFLYKLGLDANLYKQTVRAFGLSLETVVDRNNLKDNQLFCEFYEKIEPSVKENARREFDSFLKYFDSFHCTSDIQIVDVGWRCTMQTCLGKLLPDNTRIMGYYLGVRENAAVKVGKEAEGFFLNGENDEKKKCFLASMIALIEIFFSAPHGSVERYFPDGSVSFFPYECENIKESKQLVSNIQEGALRFVREFNDSKLAQLIDCNPKYLFDGLENMGKVPAKEELKLFSEFPFQMGTGIVKAADPKTIITYILNPKILLYDFSNSNWKLAFLKKLIKIRLPYYHIFSWIYRHNQLK